MEQTTINELQVNGIKYVRKDSIQENSIAEKVDGLQFVIIRSYGAGVHFGYLKSESFTEAGKVVTLVKTRRVFYWKGAASLSQMAIDGIKYPESSQISMELESNEIVNVIETIPCTEAAKNNLQKQPIWKQ